MITPEKWIDLLVDAGMEPQPYSGRGMYGLDCVSITTGNVFADIANIAEVIADDIEESARRPYWALIGRTLQDSMGREAVMYWPSMEWPGGAASDS